MTFNADQRSEILLRREMRRYTKRRFAIRQPTQFALINARLSGLKCALSGPYPALISRILFQKVCSYSSSRCCFKFRTWLLRNKKAETVWLAMKFHDACVNLTSSVDFLSIKSFGMKFDDLFTT